MTLLPATLDPETEPSSAHRVCTSGHRSISCRILSGIHLDSAWSPLTSGLAPRQSDLPQGSAVPMLCLLGTPAQTV